MDGAGAGGLDRTSSRVFGEANALLQIAIDKVSAARSAGNSRSKGYASLTVLIAGLVFQSGGIFALGKLAPTIQADSSSARAAMFTTSEAGLISSNLGRIKANVDEIIVVKNKIAPSMPVDANALAIKSAADDLQTLLAEKGGGKVASK
ncbi:hypothetical protein J5226_19545 [Lysobacter sp. K5869]|uniref:hypothetical protein n=1 Tax=Lysobacter sp. K5869 TaxID=2820808 RepID=UPI001C05F630|nr:hypothetical protein [Lysobacter sp. K5869]QWP75782.1 hypothetical protein J5226_19545 [Lysobacter sp. K5869]